MIFGYKIDESISLKILEQREAPLLFKLVDSNREYLSEFLPFVEYTTTVEDSKKFIRSALVGVIGLHYLDLVNKKTSIGYYLAETFQKKGIMTKCTEALIRYIYEEFDVNRIEICMSTDNKKSQSIPQRLGFTKEGTLRSNERLHGKFSDSYVYSLLREEYDHSLSLNN